MWLGWLLALAFLGFPGGSWLCWLFGGSWRPSLALLGAPGSWGSWLPASSSWPSWGLLFSSGFPGGSWLCWGLLPFLAPAGVPGLCFWPSCGLLAFLAPLAVWGAPGCLSPFPGGSWPSGRLLALLAPPGFPGGSWRLFLALLGLSFLGSWGLLGAPGGSWPSWLPAFLGAPAPRYLLLISWVSYLQQGSSLRWGICRHLPAAGAPWCKLAAGDFIALGPILSSRPCAGAYVEGWVHGLNLAIPSLGWGLLWGSVLHRGPACSVYMESRAPSILSSCAGAS